jgi:putative PEP-CTERM system histidine kinase
MLIRALTRAGLFKVDVYPSERVLQSSIAGLLAGAYLLAVGVLARLVTVLGGDRAFPLKAFFIIVALAGLAVLLLSERMRQYVHDFVARHFGRPQYDYRTAWLTLTERTASILDPEHLSRTIATWISETLHVLSVTIWLVDEQMGELKLAASTCFNESTTPVSRADQQKLIEALKQVSDPFIVEEKRGAWVETLTAYYADYFKTGGSRVCVPLITRGNLAGMITLGDRVNAAPYGGEELDLLKCIGEQFASNLLNQKLSTELVQAKELEAFQTISAFFVHDLKNTASTLSLMLQNFRTHIDNPDFREDALRAISKATSHIQELIQRLSMVRQRLELRNKPVDLNELLKAATECLKGRPELRVVHELAPVPAVQADPEQLNKVFTNLLLNAAEATSNRGEVRLGTCQQNGWLVVSVADNGCGMSPEFIRKSLFRPFQSTKKGGLGIGMFHTRMIVEAHRGRIEVQSQPGTGTSFRVLLPCNPST